MKDLPVILNVFARARAFMKENGNPNQWKNHRPDPDLIRQDLQEGRMFAVCNESGIHGVFSLLPGRDWTYDRIENGSWLNDEPYAAIHRVASDGQIHGFFRCLLAFCIEQAEAMDLENLRMDTHEDNRIMRHLLKSTGFVECGIIYTDDGTPRLAFQKRLED